MANSGADNCETENIWRWLSHSENSIFIQDGLSNLKDLLIPSQDEMPPSESVETFKHEGEDIPRLVKTIQGKDVINIFETQMQRTFLYF